MVVLEILPCLECGVAMTKIPPTPPPPGPHLPLAHCITPTYKYLRERGFVVDPEASPQGRAGKIHYVPIPLVFTPAQAPSQERSGLGAAQMPESLTTQMRRLCLKVRAQKLPS